MSKDARERGRRRERVEIKRGRRAEEEMSGKRGVGEKKGLK